MLVGGTDNFISPSCWFSLNNIETVKALIVQHLVINISIFQKRHSYEIWSPWLAPVSRYWAKLSDGGISNFQISGQSLIKENYCNPRISDDIDIKLGPVTKFDKRNKKTSKKIWQWRHVSKLWCHRHFSDLWSIWSNPETGFPTHSL